MDIYHTDDHSRPVHFGFSSSCLWLLASLAPVIWLRPIWLMLITIAAIAIVGDIQFRLTRHRATVRIRRLLERHGMSNVIRKKRTGFWSVGFTLWWESELDHYECIEVSGNHRRVLASWGANPVGLQMSIIVEPRSLVREKISDLTQKANDLKFEGDLGGALKARIELDAIFSKHAAYLGPLVANLNSLASLAVATGDMTRAENAARRCVECARPMPRERRFQRQDFATYLSTWAMVLAELKRFDEAVALFDEAIILFLKDYSPEDPFIAVARKNREDAHNRVLRRYLER